MWPRARPISCRSAFRPDAAACNAAARACRLRSSADLTPAPGTSPLRLHGGRSPPRNLGSEALPHSLTGAAPARDGQGRSSAAFSRHLSRNDLLYFLFSSQSAGRLRVGVIALGGEDHAPIQRW